MTDTRLAATALMKPYPTFGYRWAVLLSMSLAVYGSYYAFDSIGPLAPLLSRQLHFSDSAIGLLQASYSLANIVILLVAGILIDRIGSRKSIMLFGSIVFVGLLVSAVTPRLTVMATGRLILGAGAESLAMATHVAIARWFWRGELSFSFAIRSSVCRLGSLSAQTSPTWARAAYTFWQWPLFISVGFGGFCVLGALLFWILDMRGERRFELGATEQHGKLDFKEAFRFNRSYWLLTVLCVTFYACIFPFQTFGQKFLILARRATPETASLLVGMEPLFSMIGMPVFGHLVDRFGKRSLFMMVGSLILVPVFLMLMYTDLSPAVPMAMMGISFALVPAVLWMSVVYVVPRSRLGFASGLMDAIQQSGLVAMNLVIGWTNDYQRASAANPAGYHASLWIFSAVALLSVLFALLLRRVETGPAGHGLETITA